MTPKTRSSAQAVRRRAPGGAANALHMPRDHGHSHVACSHGSQTSVADRRKVVRKDPPRGSVVDSYSLRK